MEQTKKRVDSLVRQLWRALRDYSDEVDIHAWEIQDLELWERITQHQAVQSRLTTHLKEE